MNEDGVGVNKPSPEAIIADGMLSIIAGSDTSAIALSHVFYFFLRKPECLRKLQAEIDHVFPQGEDTMDFTEQAEMPYLNACMLSVYLFGHFDKL